MVEIMDEVFGFTKFIGVCCAVYLVGFYAVVFMRAGADWVLRRLFGWTRR